VLAWVIGREFATKARENVINVAPQVGQPIPDLLLLAGQPFRHVLAAETFTDADPGDVLHLQARRHDGQALPSWIQFHARERAFAGVAPAMVVEDLTIIVIASDVDGLEAQSTFYVRFQRS
jgi:hypothetical protein